MWGFQFPLEVSKDHPFSCLANAAEGEIGHDLPKSLILGRGLMMAVFQFTETCPVVQKTVIRVKSALLPAGLMFHCIV